jgi:hypothetical protein
MALIKYDTNQLSKILKCSESAITKGIERAKLRAMDTVKVKGQIFYFQKNTNKSGYSFSSVPFETNGTMNINIDTDISDITLNIFVNGVKVK